MVIRPRIAERFARAARFPVTLVVAPAGFGKSVAMRDFLESAQISCVRYDVARGDASVFAFSRGLVRAASGAVPGLEEAYPEAERAALALDDPVPSLADWFMTHFAGLRTTFAIDDLHNAAVDPRAAALAATLVERMAGFSNWIVATRSDAGLPIASWIAYGRMDAPIGERELAFTAEETAAAAADAGAHLGDDDLRALGELTQGWPVALAIVTRTNVNAGDFRSTIGGTREMIYRYLAEQVFSSLSREQREFLLQTSVLGTFPLELAAVYGADRAFMDDLRAYAGFVSEIAPGVFRYHDLFGDFLESELQRRGEQRYTAALLRAARGMEAFGDERLALSLYTRAYEEEDVARMLAANGARLLERGESDVLSPALAVLSPERAARDAGVLVVKAMLEAARGHFDLAERDFLDAAAHATSDEQRLRIVHRYAIESIRAGHDAVTLLEPYAADAAVEPALRVPLLGTYATALVRAGKTEAAASVIARGVATIDGTVDDEARARFYQQAAFVHHLLPSRGHAWDYANLAVELAQARGLHDVAARALSALYIIIYDDEDDPVKSLAMLERLIDAARRGGNMQTRLYGLMCSYDIQVDRGDEEAIDRLEVEIERCGAGTSAITHAETMLPARALRAAWDADFGRAFILLTGTAPLQITPDRRALRAAEIALYAIAAGRGEDGERAMAEAGEALANVEPHRRRALRARLLLALAELVRGHGGAAHRLIGEAERGLSRSSRRVRSFANAVRVAYRRSLGQAEDADIAQAMEHLRADHFGGLARLIEALPVPGAPEHGSYALLTSSERGILALLAQGASSKEIAARTARSAQTVDTHIRSICRKLQCRGRREAVALAVRHGWVQS